MLWIEVKQEGDKTHFKHQSKDIQMNLTTSNVYSLPSTDSRMGLNAGFRYEMTGSNKRFYVQKHTSIWKRNHVIIKHS